MTALDAAQIPALAELQSWPQWVAWRLEPGLGGRPCKVPYDPRSHRRASVAAPASWAAFDVVEAAVRAAQPGAYQGVGFVLTAGDPFIALDLDHCVGVVDPVGAEPLSAIRGHRLDQEHDGVGPDVVAPWARALVAELASYTEITPSGHGLRIIVRGSLPPQGRRRGPLEMYDARRFVTVTGNHLPGTALTIEDRPEILPAIHTRTFGAAADPWPGMAEAGAVDPPTVSPGTRLADRAVTGRLPLSEADAALLTKAQAARNGARFTALWTGQWRDLGYPSQSEADLALCALLAYRTGGDPASMDRLFRASALMRPKWDETRGRLTYGASTIRLALSRSMFGCRRSV